MVYFFCYKWHKWINSKLNTLIKNIENNDNSFHEGLIKTLEKKLKDIEAKELAQWEAQASPDPSQRMPAEIFKQLNQKLLKKYSCDTYLVTDEIIKKLSTTVNPQPIIGVVKMLNHNVEILNDILKSPKSRILILDNLNDKVNINEEYMYIRIYTNSLYKNINIFITNKVEELEILVEKLKQKEEEERQKYNIGDTDDKYTY